MSSQKLCPSPGSPAIRLLVLAVLLILSIPDANAYLVRRTNYVSDAPVLEAECGALDPASQCFPGDSQSNDTSVAGSVTLGAYTSQASADLATGELKIEASGPTYNALATAEYSELLTFTGIAPATTVSLGVIFSIDGTYRDGSTVTVSGSLASGDYLSGQGDYLSLDLFLIGNGNQAQPGDPVSGTVFSVADPCTSCILGGSGDWSVFGPEMFVGQVDILGSDPEVNIYMKLVGEGYFDLGNTARLSLVLPQGVSFTSQSGTFLSAQAVPLPATGWLLATGLFGWVGFIRHHRRKAVDGVS